MMDRRRLEIELLREKYGELEVGPSLNYIIFSSFQLPEGWNMEIIRVLVIIPGNYPISPPDNFYVTPGLRTINGAPPGSYAESQNHYGKDWGVFSMHLEDAGTWNPSTDNVLDVTNLLTFMMSVVEKRLSEVN